jgi:nitric oxide reductase NorD protein
MAPIFEPEESIGQQWHRLVGGASSWPHHPEAAVRLEELRGRLGVMFRALGGPGGVRLMAAGAAVSGHRLGLRQRLGLGATEKLEAPRFDGATLELPEALDLLPRRADNEALYEWLAAWFAKPGPTPQPPADPLQADIARLRKVEAATAEARHRRARRRENDQARHATMSRRSGMGRSMRQLHRDRRIPAEGQRRC